MKKETIKCPSCGRVLEHSGQICICEVAVLDENGNVADEQEGYEEH